MSPINSLDLKRNGGAIILKILIAIILNSEYDEYC